MSSEKKASKNNVQSQKHFIRRLFCFTALSIISILTVVLIGLYTDVSKVWTTASIALLGVFMSALLVVFLEIKISKLISGYEARINDLENLSSVDKLTGLANRLRLDEIFNYEIGKAQRHGNSFSILLLDLDRFKNINDNFGNDVGDKVLQETAKLLKNNLRKTDTIGRWSGEEFLIIAPEIGHQNAMLLADKIRKIIAGNYYESVGTVTCSIGISSFHDEDSKESMTDRADRALDMAKDAGRNRVVYGSSRPDQQRRNECQA
ncbi:GGDEF domain-containing protein [Maridesulfovibrio salexigens]|uniref:diguanylate cyclase n=1 Tax=Maridesulfovibrio salexigens (strain ATCC 14822 / DSM 2638 / NCIMB 8403 / VKM B-1763) TaxID=526222 RepID=C6BW84_MARSD|nr:GGDEF domain-containing protein [Maridesulfovibrio salexigens]ACS78328.1 diguanylate cyclase [Maridesulfovibrio salexigens DSM 2638]